MKHFWETVETIGDALVPFIAMGIFYGIFIRPGSMTPEFLVGCSILLTFHFLYPVHYARIGEKERGKL